MEITVYFTGNLNKPYLLLTDGTEVPPHPAGKPWVFRNRTKTMPKMIGVDDPDELLKELTEQGFKIIN